MARIVEMEVRNMRVGQLNLSVPQPFQDVDLLDLFAGQKQKAPKAFVFGELVFLDVAREFNIGSDEHGFFALAEIDDERIILRSRLQAAFDGRPCIGG